MTVRELKNILDNYDEDLEVVIGMQQTYGSDFAIGISDVDTYKVSDWDSFEDSEEMLVVTEGRQFGTVKYED